MLILENFFAVNTTDLDEIEHIKSKKEPESSFFVVLPGLEPGFTA